MTTQRCEDLPFLPGYRTMNVTQTNFSKSHVFDKKKDKGVVVNLDAPGIGGVPLPGQKPRVAHTSRSIGKLTPDMTAAGLDSTFEPEQTPSYISFDRKVLQFFAYFQEGVTEARLETFRYRKVKIFCYLEDDSMQVNEIAQENSGIVQGTFLRRHQIPKPGKRGEFYKWEDLNIGEDIEMYGVTYHIVDCDQFTKNFFEKAGMQLNEPEEMPVDAFDEDAAAKAKHAHARGTADPDKLALQQFLHLDRKVLRFYGVWDDRVESFGDLRQFVVHFYLSDDTMEINETKKNNSGYLDFPVFSKRQRVPKKFIGVATASTHDASKTAYITASDLMVGRTITVYSRPILLYDCDAFTKKYYQDVYGVTEFPVVTLPKAVTVIPEREIPPWDGIGSEEDTMENVKHLIPKPAKKDFPKMIAFEGVVFRYKARLLGCTAQDAKRRFIFCGYPATDTVSMFEPADRNSGTVTGKFLDRGKFKLDDGDGSEYLHVNQLTVGKVYNLLGRHILLYDADDFTLHYKLGHSLATALTTLPMLEGYPIQPDVDAAVADLRTTLEAAGVKPEQAVRLCASAKAPGYMSLATLRSCLLEWGMEPSENTFLGLTALLDPEMRNESKNEDFLSLFKSTSS